MRWRVLLDKAVRAGDRPDWLVKILNAPKPPRYDTLEVTALSGGKDSTAMALAQEYFEPSLSMRYAITPTGDELPDMVAHWALLEDMLGAKLEVVGDRTLMGLIVEQKALPNHKQRWCTRLAKLEPYYGWLATLGPVVSHVGLRADEEGRPGMVFPSVNDITMDFPMQRWGWTLDDVLAFLAFLGVEVPDRTDCALCFWQKLGEWYLLWLNHRDRYDRGVMLEDLVTAFRGTVYTFRSPSRDAWPASLRELAAEFAKGRIPTRSLAMMDKRRLVGACRVCTL